MLVRFLEMLRAAGIPVSLTEFLALLAALEARVIGTSVDDFYLLSRTLLIKDERHYDRFDRVFAAHFRGLEEAFAALQRELPEDWLRKELESLLDEEAKARARSLGSWDALMEALKERLEPQKGRHQGGSEWIGTGGTSPFG
ncbi:MAG: VWA domain-containing protein, partial [Steroidobacteraceae bacterium]